MRFGNDSFGFVLNLLLLCALALGSDACAQQPQAARAEESRQHQRKSHELRLESKLQAALAEQEKAVALMPDDAQAQLILASICNQIYQQDKQPEKLQQARAAAERAVKLNTDDALSHSVLADVLAQQGDKQKAIEAQKEAVRIDPNNVRYITNLGTYFGGINDYTSEREQYQKALVIDSNYISALYNLALLELEQGEISRGKNLLKQVIKNPSSEDEELKQIAKVKLRELDNK